MNKLTIAMVLAAVSLAGSACGTGQSHVVDGASPAVTARSLPVGVWKAVIGDWEADGRFSRPHSCAAVKAATAHLPHDAI